VSEDKLPATFPELACLTVSGADATTFLHGQFCADLLPIPVGEGCLTAWCTAKGRVITTVIAIRQAEGWLLLLPANLVERVTQRLRMFVLRADVVLQRGGEQGPAGWRDWARFDVQSGLPWVDADTSEKFLPQELNLERWQGLSYTKGCYPGQEIVARLRYRGTVKRGLFRLRAAGSLPAALVSGRRLLNTAGEPVATVLYTAASGPGEVLALAVMDFSAATGPVLFCEPGGAPITVMGPVEKEI